MLSDPSPLLSPNLLSSVSEGEALVTLAATIRALSDLLPSGYTRPWSLSEIAEVADLEPEEILSSIHARLPRGTHMQRWDALRDLLRETEITPPGGWTATALAELAGIPIDTITDLTGRAIRNARANLAAQGIHKRRDLTSSL
jgi:hypothetical protein